MMKRYGIQNTVFIWILKGIQITAVVAMIASICLLWRDTPDIVPVHYNFFGNPDRWGDKIGLLIMPMVGLVIYLIMNAVSHFPSMWNMPVKILENHKQVSYQYMYAALEIMITIMIWFFSYFTISSLLEWNLSVWAVVLLLGGCSIPMAWACIKIYKINKRDEMYE